MPPKAAPPPPMKFSGPHGEPTEAETKILIAKVLKAPKFQPILHKAYALGALQLFNFFLAEAIMICCAIWGKNVTWMLILLCGCCVLLALGTLFTIGYVRSIRGLEDPYELTNALTRLAVANIVTASVLFTVSAKLFERKDLDTLICGENSTAACTSKLAFLEYAPLAVGIVILIVVPIQIFLAVRIYKDPIMNPKDPSSQGALQPGGSLNSNGKDPLASDDSENEHLIKNKDGNEDPMNDAELGKARAAKKARKNRR